MEMPYVFELDATTLTDPTFSLNATPSNTKGRRVKKMVKCRECMNKVKAGGLIKCPKCLHFKCAACFMKEIQDFGKIACGTVTYVRDGNNNGGYSKTCEGAIPLPKLVSKLGECDRIKLRKMMENEIMREQMLRMAEAEKYLPVYEALEFVNWMRHSDDCSDYMRAYHAGQTLKSCLESHVSIEDAMSFVCQGEQVPLLLGVLPPMTAVPVPTERKLSQGEKKLATVYQIDASFVKAFAHRAVEDKIMSKSVYELLTEYMEGISMDLVCNKEAMWNKTRVLRVKFLAGKFTLEEFKTEVVKLYEYNWSNAIKMAVGLSAVNNLYLPLKKASVNNNEDDLYHVVTDMLSKVSDKLAEFAVANEDMSAITSV